MKRFGVVLAVLLVMTLVLPTAALAAEDPIPLQPPAEGVLMVPAHTLLLIPAGWVAGNRGLAMKGPQFTQFFFTIKDSDSGEVVLTSPASESGEYWLAGVSSATPEMVGFDLTPFNSHIGAKPFTKEWAYTIVGGLDAGSYTMESGCVQTRSAIDLLLHFPGEQHSPHHIPAGRTDFPAWDFIVY